MSTTPLNFTGVSQFSTDLQTILTRAIKIAQVPVTRLQNKDSDVLQQKTLLATLNSSVSGLAASLGSLATTAANQGLAASSSDVTKVTAIATGATAAASYTIDSITSIASSASARSNASYADSAATPVSANGSVKLVVGPLEYAFTLANNTLVGLRDQINSLGAGVTASILTTAAGNYLSITANATGATAIELRDDPDGANTNLLTQPNPGSNAVFKLNGIDVTQAGNVVNSVIPGVTFALLAASAAPVTLNVGSDRTKLSSALQDFVTSYNALHAQLAAQVGPAAGLLTGDTAIIQLQGVLRQIASHHAGGGTIRSLADLGVEFSNTGEASFKQTTFDQLSSTQLAEGFAFLKPAAGFSARLQQFSDPITGLIRIEQDGLSRTDRNIVNQIATLNDRIAVLQVNLSRQLQIADSLLAHLESQKQYLTASLQGLSFVLYGKNVNS